jgi:S1-C subfamily serine protease
MPDFSYTGKGVRIADCASDSPAAHAGLQKGDVIIQIGKFKISNLREYSEALKSFNPGDEVDLKFNRDGKESLTKIKLGTR